MTPSDSLFQLIHALSPSEKRYFRMYASLHSRESSQTIELFERLNTMEKFDHAALIGQPGLSHPLLQNLSARKNYLHHLILRSMRNYHSEKSIRAQAEGLLQDAIFLYHKTLYAQSTKVLRKAARLARKIEYHSLAIEVKTWENRINKKRRLKGRQNRTIQIHKVKQEIVLDWQSEIDLKALYDRMFLESEVNSFLRSKEEVIVLNALLQKVQDSPQTTFWAKHYALMSEAIHAQLTGDFQSAYAMFKELLAWWESRPALIEEEDLTYKATVSNLLGACYLTRQFDRFPPLLEKLMANPSDSPHGQLQLMQQYFTYKMLHCINTNQHETGEKVSHETWEWWKENRHLISQSREFTIAFNCVIFALIHCKFEQGLQWINVLVNQRQAEMRWDVQFFLRLLRIIFHFELNSIDILESLFRSLLRFHKRHRNRPEESRLIRQFELSLQMKPGMKRKQAFCELVQAIRAVFQGTQEKAPPGIREIKFWMDCKCKGLPLQRYAEAYFNGT